MAEAGGVTGEPLGSFQMWWASTDDVSQKRALNLQRGDFLPGDLALDMQLHGMRVIAVGVAWSEEYQEWVGLYEQPAELVAFLEEFSDDYPG